MSLDLTAILGGLVALLGFVAKFFHGRAKREKERRKSVESDLNFRRDVDESETEIRQEQSRRASEAKKDLDNDEIPDHLRRPR